MKRLALIFLVVWLLLLGACAPTLVSEPEIPARFTTYTDELALFSISYPPDWELALSGLEFREQAVKGILESLWSDAPVEELSVIFAAGLPTEAGYVRTVSILVESLPRIVWTHDYVVEAEVQGLKKVIQDYQELSRVRTTVGGREATIVEYKGTHPMVGKFHWLQMMTLVGKNVWIVSCTALPGDFNESEDDFHAIVRSLRILK